MGDDANTDPDEEKDHSGTASEDSDGESGVQVSWDDADEVAELLFGAFPSEDPLTIRFVDLQARVCKLPEFSDDAAKSSEAKLEATQMAWLELYEEEHGP